MAYDFPCPLAPDLTLPFTSKCGGATAGGIKTQEKAPPSSGAPPGTNPGRLCGALAVSSQASAVAYLAGTTGKTMWLADLDSFLEVSLGRAWEQHRTVRVPRQCVRGMLPGLQVFLVYRELEQVLLECMHAQYACALADEIVPCACHHGLWRPCLGLCSVWSRVCSALHASLACTSRPWLLVCGGCSCSVAAFDCDAPLPKPALAACCCTQEFERWEAAEVAAAVHLIKQQKGVPRKGAKVCMRPQRMCPSI